MSKRYDVIVIGVGSMGSAACYYLARAGKKVLGIEQFSITHERGSHAGQSRIIRKAYFEHPDYVPLLARAYENWNHIEQEAATSIFHRTGIVYFGRADHATMEGVRTAAALYNIPLDKTATHDRKRFPQFTMPSDFEMLVEPNSGFVRPEHAILTYVKLAREHGAEFATGERVVSWNEINGSVEVSTDKTTYSAAKLVITAGSWTSKILPQLPANLQVTRQLLAWVQPKDTELFRPDNFPCWFVEDPEKGMFYGFPILDPEKFGGPSGLKIAHHRRGQPADPDLPQNDLLKKDESNIQHALARYLPTAQGPIVHFKYCLYTYSDDENFIIDFLPGFSRHVIIACGFSGHGFKFVSAIGEILADLAVTGKSDLPIDFLRLSRFR